MARGQLYLCKTSGTTSGAKYIPITKESLPNHISSARRALLAYIAHSGRTDFVDGKMIFLQGSPVLDKELAHPKWTAQRHRCEPCAASTC